jgi:hypothetical protein
MSMISFGMAIRYCMNEGKRITRIGWNGADMWVCHIEASTASVDALLEERGTPECIIKLAEELGGKLSFTAKFALKDANNNIQVGWAPSQADMCATDWIVLDD